MPSGHFVPKNSKSSSKLTIYGNYMSISERHTVCPMRVLFIKKDGRYHLDFDDLSKRLGKDDVHAFLLVNPHNPTGNCWSKNDLEKVADVCEQKNVMLFSDEIHCDFIAEDSTFTPVYSLIQKL